MATRKFRKKIPDIRMCPIRKIEWAVEWALKS